MKKIAGFLAGVLALSACGFVGCGERNEDVTVYMPDGAPALALAKLMSEDVENDGVTYRVVDPTTIKSRVTYDDMQKNADLCVMPVAAASALLGKGDKYKMLGVVTHGNLYMIAKEKATVTDVAELAGKSVGVLQIADVPGLTLKWILNNADVAWAENSATNGVNLVGMTNGNDIAISGVEYYVLGEPAASAKSNVGFSIVGDLQSWYGGENGYPQAVLVAKSSIVTEKEEWLRSFAAELVQAAEWLSTASGEEIVSAVRAHVETGYDTTLQAGLLTTEVLGRCGVWFSQSKDCKTEVLTYMQRVKTVDDKRAVPSDAFFCSLDLNVQ